jgi:hypothetical protein
VKVSMPARLLQLVLSSWVAGSIACAHRVETAAAGPQLDPARSEEEVAHPAEPEEASEELAGADEVIDFTGLDIDAGPAPIVAAPPERPAMPSMMPGVVTGPSGQAPGG